ncbi:MAG: hypothetical protein ACTSYG_07615 [Candidatus Heimdallarchaeota archaeon]
METSKAEAQNTKVNYDARLNFYEVIGGIWKGIVLAGINQDTELEFNLLRDMFSMIAPYIKPADKTTLHQKLNLIKIYFSMSKEGNSRERISTKEIKDKIYEFKMDFFEAGKHMWIPTQEKDNDEYNFEDIMRGNE